MSRASVKRHLAVLEEAGWVGRDRPDVVKARTEHARTGYRLMVPEGAGLTVSLGSGRAQPGSTESPDLGSRGAQARPTVSPKSSCSSSSAGNSSLSSASDPSPPPAPVEREIEASPKSPTAAQRVLRSSGLLTPDEEQPFIVWATAKFNIQGPGWWRTCAPDLPEHIDTWRTTLVVHERRPSLPPWCGTCADGWTAARVNPRLRMVELLGKQVPCPDCHPSTVAAA